MLFAKKHDEFTGVTLDGLIEGIADVRMNRPDKRNALDNPLFWHSLHIALRKLSNPYVIVGTFHPPHAMQSEMF